MSTQSSTFSGNILKTNYNRDKIFIFENRYKNGSYTNGTGDDVDLALGTVMGRITSSGKWKPWDATATDGSEQPRGVLAAAYSVADGATQSISICISGDVAQEQLVFTGEGQTLETVVTHTYNDTASPANTTSISYGRCGDLLEANSTIILREGEAQDFHDDYVA